MLAHVGGCVASVGPCWANLRPTLPHLEAMSAHLKQMLSNLGPMLAQKKTKRKNHGKPMDSQGFAGMLTLCWPILDALLVHLGAWSVLGARLSHLGAMLARLEDMLTQHARRNARTRTKIQTQTKTSRKTPKPHATEGSPQSGPRLTRFRGRGRRQGARASIRPGAQRGPYWPWLCRRHLSFSEGERGRAPYRRPLTLHRAWTETPVIYSVFWPSHVQHDLPDAVLCLGKMGQHSVQDGPT